MKRLGTAALFTLGSAALPVLAWEPAWTATWTYDEPSYGVRPLQLMIDEDGATFALVEVVYDTATHAAVVKFAGDGTFEWTREREVFSSAGEALLPGQRVVIAGTADSGAGFVRVIDGSDGSLVWEHVVADASFSSIGPSDIRAIVAASDGSILVCANDGNDIVVVRFDADGTALPEWRWTVPDGPVSVSAIAATADGGAVVAGAQDLGHGFVTVRFDAAGEVQFGDVELGDIGNPLGPARVVVGADDTTTVAAGPESHFGVAHAQAWKIAADGTRQWTQPIPLAGQQGDNLDVSGLALATNGDAIVAVTETPEMAMRTVRLSAATGDRLADASSTQSGQPTGFSLAPNGRALVAGFEFIDFMGHVAPVIAEFDAAGHACRSLDDLGMLDQPASAAGEDGWYVMADTHPVLTLQHYDASGPCDGADPEVVFVDGFDPPG